MNETTENLLDVLAQRLKQTRISVNLTQQQVADRIGKSRTAIERAEKGKCNLDTFVSILMALGVENQLDLFLPEPPPSPVLLAKAQGTKRQRASKTDTDSTHKDDLGW